MTYLGVSEMGTLATLRSNTIMHTRIVDVLLLIIVRSGKGVGETSYFAMQEGLYSDLR
jgi:hypothetical protein